MGIYNYGRELFTDAKKIGTDREGEGEGVVREERERQSDRREIRRMGVSSNVRSGFLVPVVLMVFILLVLVQEGYAIWLNLPGTGTKCVSEEIQNNVVVLADYVVISDNHVHPTPSVATKVTTLTTPIYIYIYIYIICACIILYYCLFVKHFTSSHLKIFIFFLVWVD